VSKVTRKAPVLRKSIEGAPQQGLWTPPLGYKKFLDDLKGRIRAARIKATLSVNRELIGLYWDIGKSIVERQRTDGRGRSIVECLATDIQREFPGIAGFSSANIWRMRAFYLAYTDEAAILARSARGTSGKKVAQVARDSDWEKLPSIEDLERRLKR